MKLKTTLIVAIAVLVIAAGLLVGAVRLADLLVPEYRDEVAARVSERLDRPVGIGGLDLSWDWGGPVLHLNEAKILDETGDKSVIRLQNLALHFGFLDLIRGQLQPQGITLSGPTLAAYRDAEGRIRVRGFQASETATDWQEIATKIAELDFIRVQSGTLLWRPRQASTQQIVFRDINFSLSNEGPRHKLVAGLNLPAELGQAVQFESLVIGDVAQLQNLRAHTYLNADELDLSALVAATGVEFSPPDSGRNNLEAWADWQAGHFDGARVSVTAAASQSDNSQSPRLLPANTGIDLSMRPTAQGYTISIDALRDNQGYRKSLDGSVHIDLDATTIDAQIENLPATFLNGWLAMSDRSRNWQVQGQLDQINLDYNYRNTPGALTGKVIFSQGQLNNKAHELNLNGLNGSLDFSRSQGSLTLKAKDGELNWGDRLNGALPVDTLAGTLAWQRDNNGWRLAAEQLRWLGADAKIVIDGSLVLTPQTKPQADISAQVQAMDLPRILAHIPRGPQNESLPNAKLRDWLPKAIKGGKLLQGEVNLRGALDDFPFAQGNGLFRVKAELENTRLDYKPGWPELSEANGNLTLQGDTLDIDASSGQMLGITVGPATAHVENVREPILEIDGTVNSGNAKQMLSFLANSPLQEKFGKLPKILDVEGQADLALDLSIPLKSELGKPEVEGTITLHDTTLAHQVLPEPIKRINGDLSFDRKGLNAQGLRGRLLELPLVADINPGAENALNINASTLLRLPRDRNALTRFVPPMVSKQIGGEGVWHAALSVSADGGVSDLNLRSDLDGIYLDFPPPLAKPASGKLPIHVTLAEGRKRIEVDLAERLAMTLRSNGTRVNRIDMRFGETSATPPAGDGLWLGGQIDTLDVLAWKRFLDRHNSVQSPESGAPNIETPKNPKPSLGFRGANLRINETLWGGQRMNWVQLDVVPLNEANGWKASLQGPGASGELRYLPPPANTANARALLDGEFERIGFQAGPRPDNEAPPEEDTQAPPQNPANLPITNIRVDQILLDQKNLGRLNLQARALADGITLNKLSITGGQLQLAASGDWRNENGMTRASLDAEVDGEGLENLVRTLGYTANIRAQDTKIDAKLEIAPNPDGLNPGALNGTLELDFEDGTLISVDPGAGRVLGLFNFYALPRRFLLDFRDVVNEGLAFDDIRADFQINNGVAHSDNVRIKTPSATVRIKGDVDLGARTYDQRVTITPKVSSGVAVAGTVLGGPLVGAALLLAQKILEKPIEDLSTIRYHLTGNWQDPEIKTLTTEQPPAGVDTPESPQQLPSEDATPSAESETRSQNQTLN